MSYKSVYAIAISEGQANQIVGSLTESGFSSNDISVLFPDKESTHEFSHAKNTKAPEGAVTGAAAGGVLGGTLGLLAGIGALAIPGVGPIIAAGPLARRPQRRGCGSHRRRNRRRPGRPRHPRDGGEAL